MKNRADAVKEMNKISAMEKLIRDETTPPDIATSVRLPKEMYDALTALSEKYSNEKRKVSQSNMIRIAVRKLLDEEGVLLID